MKNLSRITYTLAIACVLIVAISSCKSKTKAPAKHVDEGKITDNVYYSEEIGWTITIPENWDIIAKDQLEASDEIGKKLIEEGSNVTIDDGQLKHLISFQKDELNIFAATSEPFEEDYEGEFAENNKLINLLIYNTFTNQGIKVDSSSSFTKIGNQEFYHFTNKIYDPEGNLFLTQSLYSNLINGYDFAINLAYSNSVDSAVMLSALENSTFE